MFLVETTSSQCSVSVFPPVCDLILLFKVELSLNPLCKMRSGTLETVCGDSRTKTNFTAEVFEPASARVREDNYLYDMLAQ